MVVLPCFFVALVLLVCRDYGCFLRSLVKLLSLLITLEHLRRQRKQTLPILMMGLNPKHHLPIALYRCFLISWVPHLLCFSPPHSTICSLLPLLPIWSLLITLSRAKMMKLDDETSHKKVHKDTQLEGDILVNHFCIFFASSFCSRYGDYQNYKLGSNYSLTNIF